jgi:general secretion pathway protein G
MFQNRTKGFSLVEILVVTSIISLMASIVVSALSTASLKSRDAKRAASVRELKTALELYYNENGTYPSVAGDNVGTAVTNLAVPLNPYLKTIPTDPTTGVWQYVRAAANDPNYKYGLYIYREAAGAYCGTGMAFNPGWWGIGSSMCPF